MRLTRPGYGQNCASSALHGTAKQLPPNFSATGGVSLKGLSAALRLKIEDILDLWSSSKQGEYDSVTVAFAVLFWMDRENSVEIIQKAPRDLIVRIISLVDIYKKEGKYLVVSHNGVHDHAELFKSVLLVLENHNVSLHELVN